MLPKRKATKDVDDEDICIPSIKKPKPVDSTLHVKDIPYQIRITLHSKFDVLPNLLRSNLQDAYRKDLYTNQYTLITNTPRVPHHQTYQILKGNRIRSISLAFTRELLSPSISSLALANAALMEHLLSEKQPNLREDVTFSRTATQERHKRDYETQSSWNCIR